MLVIQIIRVEIKEENLVLVNPKKGEGKKKVFIFQNQKIESKEEDAPLYRFTYGKSLCGCWNMGKQNVTLPYELHIAGSMGHI